jgi:hypothetical protein
LSCQRTAVCRLWLHMLFDGFRRWFVSIDHGFYAISPLPTLPTPHPRRAMHPPTPDLARWDALLQAVDIACAALQRAQSLEVSTTEACPQTPIISAPLSPIPIPNFVRRLNNTSTSGPLSPDGRRVSTTYDVRAAHHDLQLTLPAPSHSCPIPRTTPTSRRLGTPFPPPRRLQASIALAPPRQEHPSRRNSHRQDRTRTYPPTWQSLHLQHPQLEPGLQYCVWQCVRFVGLPRESLLQSQNSKGCEMVFSST